ncbi:MAG: acetylornithine/succinylornithine family transaminase [Ruminococcus sp.]|nr:acetylornithine/succinylornithine family transaminase [Ruminococcus sp.]
MNNNENTIKKFDDYVAHSYGRYPLAMKSGQNRQCIDENNMKYIDLGSGIGCNCLGYCDEQWADAVCTQVRTLQHTSNYYYTEVQAEFAEKLCKSTGYESVFFGNSGAEANECAIKTARKYSFDKYGKGRHNIITLVNSFHGRTMATLSATGQDVFHNYFFPFLEGFINVEANNTDDLKAKLDDTVCAVMLEYVQGEGGVIALDQEFVDAVFELCAEKDILVIADEVQTGIGRTGKLLAGEWYGKKADITTLAKGIAGGIPMGACLFSSKTKDVLTAGTHGSTFGGNPIACAGGIVVIDRITGGDFLDEVNKKASYIKTKLEESSAVKSLSGKGLMIGITLSDESKKAADIAKKAFEKGLLVLTAKEKVRLLPPLNITYDELNDGIKILIEILEE